MKGGEALVLPSPLASTHALLQNDARRGHRRYPSGTSLAFTPVPNQRAGGVCLNGPMNYANMDHAGVEGAVDPINVTDLVDPAALDVLNLVDAAEVAAHVEGHAHEFNLLPRALPLVEEEVVVLEDPGASHETLLHHETLHHDAPLHHHQPPADPAKVETEEENLGVAEDHPSVAKIIKFTLPAIGVWLCSPVLSMIDTASVGLLAGTAQQAALNPAISVTDYGALLVAFMYTATTNLVAGAVEEDGADAAATDGEGKERTKRTLVTALRLALLVGATFGTVLFAAAPALLGKLIGNSSLDPEVFNAALRYVRVRSLGMPAAVVIGTAQSACLGMKDVRSPLYVLAAAAGINLLGDMLLVGNGSAWLGGAAGAAWATVMSQYGALAMFLWWLTTKGGKARGADPMEMIKDTSKKAGRSIKVTMGSAFQRGTILRRRLFSSSKDTAEAQTAKKEAPARGFLAATHSPTSVLNPLRLAKSKDAIKKFLPFVVPVTTTSIGRVSGYVTMSHVASCAFGMLDMAAHQIAISIFCCLAPVVDALNQVAQSFVPGIFARPKGKARAKALRNTSINFAKVGALFGSVIVALVAAGVPVLSRCFTADPLVLSRVREAIPGIAIFLGFDGLMCIGEGTLLGQGDLKFLRNAYASFFFLVPAFMLRLKRRALSGEVVGIGTMWGTFSAYEVVRTILWLGRVAWLQRRTEREAEQLEGGAGAA
ncbi:hypothetical protein ACHAXT_005454 [Thalassiosira profunda]